MRVTLKVSFNISDKFKYKTDKEINEYLTKYIEEINDIIPGNVAIKGEVEDGRV